jgi:hypothetical protein
MIKWVLVMDQRLKECMPNFRFMPARCLKKWLQENFGHILEFFLVDLKHIIYVIEWWWWYSF